MGYEYDIVTGAKPFVPASIALPKKKAKQLQAFVSNLTLSQAQQAVAVAYGWKDWHALEEAIKHGESPSLPDETETPDEVARRYGDQLSAFLSINLRGPDAELAVAELGLSCASATAQKRRSDVGPWGAFQGDTTEIARGITHGLCARFNCYKLSDERQAAMAAHLRIDFGGWYMDDDHGWRVVLSFPEHFSEEERKSARQDFAELDPFVHELVYGDSSKAIYCPYGPSIGWRRQRATANREAWFALSVKSFSSFDRSDDGVGDQEHYVVAAVRGSELLALMDAKGVWPATNPPEVGWFGVSRYVAQRIRGNLATQADTMVSGLPGWALPAIAEYPFVRAPFSIYELSSLDVTPLLKPLTMPTVGEAVRIE